MKNILKTLRTHISGRRIEKDTATLHAMERWFTYPKFQESASFCEQRLHEIGAQGVKIIRFKADGKTLYGSWRAPMAWDAKAASLVIAEPGKHAGKTLADYKKNPCSLVMWSGPTKKRTEAELVDVGNGTSDDDYRGKPVKGNMVLVGARAGAVKGMAAKYGAIGVATDWNPAAKALPHDLFWNNSFNDDPAGWGAAAGDSRLFGFVISPEEGRWLRSLLQSDARIKVAAHADTRIYSGHFPVVTGYIPGRSQEEVLVLGHGFEQGAKDNQSGVACMIEAMNALVKLVLAGTLPRPNRSIRILITNECFGTLGYFQKYSKQINRIKAGLCLDGPCLVKTQADCVQAVFKNPVQTRGYTDRFAASLASELWGPACQVLPFGLTDNLIACQGIGIPCVWLGSAGNRSAWHSSIDTPQILDAKQMRDVALFTAAYLWHMADTKEPFVDSETTVAPFKHTAKSRKSVSKNAIVPKPCYRGPLSLDPLTPDKKQGHNDARWGGSVFNAINFMDGQRTLSDIVQLTENQMKQPLPQLRKEILFLIKNNLVCNVNRERPRS